MEYTRYAVYYAPEPGAFADFGARWLGWDAAAATECPHPAIEGLPAPVSDLTKTPRKYGLHGTLKPPFRLSTSPQALISDLAALTQELAPVCVDRLALASLGSFIALTPEGDSTALSDLASRVVEALDSHRAPLEEAELARRRGKGLAPALEANLNKWGYPYVMEHFRFHMTLTGRLPAETRAQVLAALAPRLEPLLPVPFTLRELCLFAERPDGRFVILHRYALTG